MNFPGASGRRQQEPEHLPPMTPLPLARQGSVYSLTFDEFQSSLGGAAKDFGSMNMDELLRSIWSAEEIHNVAAANPSAATCSVCPSPGWAERCLVNPTLRGWVFGSLGNGSGRKLSSDLSEPVTSSPS